MARGGMARIGEAALLAGVSRSTMHRALKAGRVSYQTDDRGERLIDPAEVARAFPDTARTVPWNGSWNAETRQLEPPETATALEVRLAVAEALLGEREITELRELVADLRRRLDAAEAERRQITLALTDQRPQTELERPLWWRRWWRES